jgi:dTMP kinase
VAEPGPDEPAAPARRRAFRRVKDAIEQANVHEMPTVELTGVEANIDPPSALRLFGTRSFFRLWLAQVVSSLGDWIGLIAVLSLAQRIGGSQYSIALVMTARMLPGFFLASVGGVLVDRWDRRRVMVACDIGRGLCLALLPLCNAIWQLWVVSFVIEILTLLWTPAKEASVPNMVATEQLSTANSLSLAAAYGTFPLAGLIFAALAKVAQFLGHHAPPLDVLKTDQESLAIYFDVITFFASALLISTLVLKRNGDGHEKGRIDLGATFRELREGWQFIGSSPIVRAVMVGLATGLFGGAMVVPLGPVFAKEILHAGAAGFGLLFTSLGFGVAGGVVSLSALQRRIPRIRIFPMAVIGAGAFLAAASMMSTLAPAMALIVGMGVCTGAGYVLGFTLLQEHVADELRGRIFAALYALVRFCVLLSLTVSPVLAGALDTLSHRVWGRTLHFAGFSFGLPGVRLTLLFGASVIVVAGALVRRTLNRVDIDVDAATP